MYIISTLINRQDCDLLHDLCMAARAYFGKLGIVTIISVVLFCVVWSFCDVYLCILACIFIHKLLHSYTHDVDKFDFKKWYKSGDVVLICRLFWIASGEYVLVFV